MGRVAFWLAREVHAEDVAGFEFGEGDWLGGFLNEVVVEIEEGGVRRGLGFIPGFGAIEVRWLTMSFHGPWRTGECEAVGSGLNARVRREVFSRRGRGRR